MGVDLSDMSRSPLMIGALSAFLLFGTSRADVVTDWSNIALETVRATNTKPPVATRVFAMVHVAMFEAVNGVTREYDSYLDLDPAPEGTSAEVAAACAAHYVLVNLHPIRGEIYNRALQESLAAIPGGSAKNKGERYGRSVGVSITESRRDDGAFDIVKHQHMDQLGMWAPTPPTYMPALLPQWPHVTPWVVTHAYQFRACPPPALDSAEYASALEEVKAFGSVKSSVRTDDQTEIALFWSDGAWTTTPPGHWLQIAQLLGSKLGNDLAENARMLALLSIAQADAAIISWDTKYYYEHWRPCQGIVKANLDGNPATEPDPAWKCLIATPPFGSYTSGHSIFSGVSARVLELFFGTDEIPFTAGSPGLPGVERSWNSLTEAANEGGQSRIYGGIHWQYDNSQGLFVGRKLADYVFRSVMRPVVGEDAAQSGAITKAGATRHLPVRLSEGDTGRPIEGARVSLLDAVASSDASGGALVPLPAESLDKGGWVCVDAPGFFPECTLWNGREPEIVVRVWHERSLAVETRDSRSGLPVGSARISVDQKTDTSRGRLHAFSDAEGKASIAVRPNVPFELHVESRGFRDYVTSTVIEGGERLVVDLDSQPIVEGAITFADGTSAEGVDVELWTDEPEDEDFFGLRLVSSGQVSPDGRYRLGALAGGELLQVRARDRRGRHAESRVFTVDPDELQKDIPLVLDWTGGQIVVKVVDEAGNPVPDVSIVVTAGEEAGGQASGMPTNFLAFERTNPHGEAICSTRRAGPHWVHASVKTALDARKLVDSRSAAVNSQAFMESRTVPDTRSLDSQSGAIFHRSRVDVARAQPVALEIRYPQIRRLVGRVLEPAGGAITDASIRFRKPKSDPSAGDVSEEATTTTDATGRFQIDGLTATAGELTIRGSTQRDESELYWYLQVPSVIPDSEERLYQMPEPARLSGRIAGSGAAEQVVLSLRNPDETFLHLLAPAADGAFSLLTGVLGDSILLDVIDVSGGSWLSSQVELLPRGALDLGTLQASTTARPGGVVVDDLGKAIAHCNVMILDEGDRLLYEAVSDADGGLPLPLLPAVRGRIELLEDEGIWHTIPCADLSRIDGDDFVLHSLVRLEGQLTREGEGRLGRAELLAVHVDGGGAGSEDRKKMSDPEGRFTFDLLPGRIQLFAKPFGALEWVAGPEIDLQPREPASVEFSLR